MNALATPFKQLVEKRLWPLAVLLVAALAAVPLVLAKKGEEVPPPSPLASTSTVEGAADPVISPADAGQIETARKVLGSKKNPFRPAVPAESVEVDEPATGGTPTTVTPPSSGGTGGSTGGSTGLGTPVTPSFPTSPTTPVSPGTPRPTIELYSIAVRFGDTSGSSQMRLVKRLKGLPGGAQPKVVYLGLLGDNKTAVFLVDAGVTVQGDGRCEPSPDDCQTLRMREGDTVFLDVGEGEDGEPKRQFQLDLVKIVTKKVHSQVTAAQARASVAKGGRDRLRPRLDRIGRYRYDESTGTLKVISVDAWKASAAKAAAAKASAE